MSSTVSAATNQGGRISHKMITTVIMAAATFVYAISVTQADVIYVDQGASPGGDGQSWATALSDLQLALLNADVDDEIWVAEGLYLPSDPVDPSDVRTVTLQLKTGVSLYGGFPTGGGDGTFEARDPGLYTSILSGDIGVANDRTDNAYHVVTGSGTDATTVLDGFTITDGNADDSTVSIWRHGGGVFIENGHPTLESCRITGNSAYSYGGGVYCDGSSSEISDCVICENEAYDGGGVYFCNNSSPTLMNCDISNNTSSRKGGGFYARDANSSPTILQCSPIGNSSPGGGGVMCHHSSPVFTDCKINGNASGQGGGIECFDSDSTFRRCSISGNKAAEHGGGMFCNLSNPTFESCMIVSNTAMINGGAVRCGQDSSPSLTNCTLTSNTAFSLGGAVYSYSTSTITLANCILWGDAAREGPEIYLRTTSTLNLSYSVVEGGEAAAHVSSTSTLNWGDGMSESDPHLTRDGTHLLASSPCRDAGDPTGDYSGLSDIDGEVRLSGGGVDIGADEFIDGDGDEMPDWWEMRYFESATDGNAEGNEDVDDRSNLDEYEWSSNPHRPPVSFYVDPAGDDAYDGMAEVWDGQHGPKATIQSAIDATDMFEGDEIAVANGTYTGDGNRNLDFQGREITLRSTGGAAGCVIDCAGEGHGFFFHSGETAASIVDGFTITGGSEEYGGGVYCRFSSPTLRNCLISGNEASISGGGVFCFYDGSPTIVNCTMSENTGGGLYCWRSNSTVVDCRISGNTAKWGGGVVCGGIGNTMLDRCIISGNKATDSGGGVRCLRAYGLTIANCAITGNAAPTGGGIQSWDSTPSFLSCTISGNTATEVGGGISCHQLSSPSITNCIFWANNAPIARELGILRTSALTVSYCDVEGGEDAAFLEADCTLNWGAGNIEADPLFVAPGYWDDQGTPEDFSDDLWMPGDYHLRLGLWASPCIDAGDNSAVITATDFDGDPRLVDIPSVADAGNGTAPIVDMGCDEVQPLSLHPTPAQPKTPADGPPTVAIVGR